MQTFYKVFDYITGNHYSYALFRTEDGLVVSEGFHQYSGPDYIGKMQYVSEDGGKTFVRRDYEIETYGLPPFEEIE